MANGSYQSTGLLPRQLKDGKFRKKKKILETSQTIKSIKKGK